MDAAKSNRATYLLVDDESAILRTFRYCLKTRVIRWLPQLGIQGRSTASSSMSSIRCAFLDFAPGRRQRLDVVGARCRCAGALDGRVIVPPRNSAVRYRRGCDPGRCVGLSGSKPWQPRATAHERGEAAQGRQLAARVEQLERPGGKLPGGMVRGSPAMNGDSATALGKGGSTDANILYSGRVRHG